jgi:hypothetical protein
MNDRIFIASELKADEKLYRYMSLSQFMSFVEQRKVYLSKIKNWDDSWEIPNSHLPVQLGDGSLTEVKGRFFDVFLGQCWSKNGDSDALWRIYSPDRQGIQIQTSVHKFKLMKDVRGILAPAIYYPNSGLLSAFKEAESKTYQYPHLSYGLLKRTAFIHEDEVRFVTMNEIQFVKNCDPDKSVIYVDLDPFNFIENILIDPRANEWYEETIQSYCQRVGFDIVPVKSDLYQPNVFTKTKLSMKFVPLDEA